VKVDIPDPISDGKHETLVDAMITGILGLCAQEECRIVLDITHGFRSLPFFYFAALTFVAEISGAEILDIVYSHGTPKKGEEPLHIVSLLGVYKLVRWAYATRDFVETGSTKDLELLLREERRLTNDPKKRAAFDHACKGVAAFARVANTTLAIDIGVRAHSLKKHFEQLAKTGEGAPVLNRLVGILIEDASRLATRVDKRERVKLDKEEIERELRTIEWMLSRGHVVPAITMMRETFVNDVLRKLGAQDWLDENTRKNAERLLGVLCKVLGPDHPEMKEKLPHQMASAISAFNAVRDMRNPLAHCGYSNQNPVNMDVATVVANGIRAIREGVDWGRAIPQPEATLLIAPLGRSIGSLFTAIKKTNPDRLIAIVSEDTEQYLDTVVQAAGFEGTVDSPVRVKDVHAAYDKIDEYAKCIEEFCLEPIRIVANVTGGTTLMGEIVRRMAQVARAWGTHVKIVAVSDRRPIEEQRANPFVLGELHVLEEYAEGDKF